MSGIISGILLSLVSVYLLLPVHWSPSWFEEFLYVLKGFVPILLFFFGLFYFIVGASDIYDARVGKKQFKDTKEPKQEN